MRRRTTIGPALPSAVLVAALALGAVAPADAATAPGPTPSPASPTTQGPTAQPTTALPSATVLPVQPTTPVQTTAPVVVPTTPTPSPTPVVPPPTASSISQTVGRVARTRNVVLTGTNLANLAAVRVGGQDVGALVRLSPTRVRFLLPAAIDFQPKVAVVSLTALADRITRPTALTFTYVVRDARDRQMGYAFRSWAKTSNSVFGYLSGSDCANFVNQTLLARGWKQSAAWFNHGFADWSATWVSSTALSTYLKKRPDLVTRLTWSQRDAVRVGDVVQFRYAGHKKGYTSWDHTAVVSKVTVLPTGEHAISVVQHSYARTYSGPVRPSGTRAAIQFFHLLH